VDAVKLQEGTMTDEQRVARLAQIRQESEAGALAAYGALSRVDPAPGSSLSVGGRFPVGFYTVRPTGDRPLDLDGIFAELAEAKVNLVHNSDFEDWPEHAANYAEINSDPRAREYLDRAAAHGLQVLMGFDRMMVVRGNTAGLQTRARALTDHPALFGWYLIDEPNLQGATPQATLAAAEAVREVDRKPLTSALCDAETMPDYEPSLDVLITDVYPVSVNSLFSLVPHIERALVASGGAKPVWAAIQVHNDDLHRIRWGGMEHLITAPRRPTPVEVRCMTFLAIAHGASGILFYAYDGWDYGKIHEDPELYEGVKALSRELHDLGPWLLCDTDARGTAQGADGTLVSYILRGPHDGRSLLIAVNAFDRPSGPVELELPGGETVDLDLQPREVVVREVGGGG